ncbi:MAG: hypothetical protein QNL92_12550 [Octadecabacter sp.]
MTGMQNRALIRTIERQLASVVVEMDKLMQSKKLTMLAIFGLNLALSVPVAAQQMCEQECAAAHIGCYEIDWSDPARLTGFIGLAGLEECLMLTEPAVCVAACIIVSSSPGALFLPPSQ